MQKGEKCLFRSCFRGCMALPQFWKVRNRFCTTDWLQNCESAASELQIYLWGGGGHKIVLLFVSVGFLLARMCKSYGQAVWIICEGYCCTREWSLDTLKPEGVVYGVAQDGLVRCDLIWSGFGQNQRLRANQSSLEPSSVPTSGLHQHRDQRRGITMWRIRGQFDIMRKKKTIWHHGIGEAINIEIDAEES